MRNRRAWTFSLAAQPPNPHEYGLFGALQALAWGKVFTAHPRKRLLTVYGAFPAWFPILQKVLFDKKPNGMYLGSTGSGKSFLYIISRNLRRFFKREYCPAKRGKHHQLSNEKGGENAASNRREFIKQCAFQKFSNTVLHNEACDAHKKLHRHKAREVTFSDLSLSCHCGSDKLVPGPLSSQ